MRSEDERLSEKLAAFESERDPARLHEALEILQEPGHADVDHTSGRATIVHRAVRLVEFLDRAMDPTWNPDAVPQTGLVPPPADGVVYPSGVDPTAIADPTVRRRYEHALQSSKQHAEQYHVQLELRRIEAEVAELLRRVLADNNAYGASARRELDRALSSTSMSDARRRWIEGL